ncbi:hypothetical protein AVEN_112431-1 [Araneus ventricosus]|uniref:Uncharacterized protein n=1 Tax=Araneus ventricosus TaxID=182803 RepID=A0A4Y2WV61_ARAVE|nr:hypothetical protein AVEN_112431-1 [Araneus ventricosus]
MTPISITMFIQYYMTVMESNFMKKGCVGVEIRACNNRNLDLLENRENSDIVIDDSDTYPGYVATDDESDSDTIDYIGLR